MINSEDKSDVKAKMGSNIANKVVKASDDSKNKDYNDWHKGKEIVDEPKEWAKSHEKKENMAVKMFSSREKAHKSGKAYIK